MGTTEQAQALEREAHKLLKELEFALKKDLLAYRDPKGTGGSYRNRYKQWVGKVDRFTAQNPHAKKFLDLIKQHTRSELDRMIAEAERAHKSRARVQGGLGGKYNDLVAGALSDAPGQGVGAVNDQYNKAVETLVFQVIQEDQIPANVKKEIARNLGGWLRQQEVVDDAFLFLQGSLHDVAKWLHQRLIITKEIERTKETVKKVKQLTPADAEAADKRVGELAKQRNELDKQIEAQIARNRTQARGYFSFNPGLVLDPAKLFVNKLELRAGIKIQKSDVVVDLGTKLQLVDPTSGDRALTVNPYANVNVGNNFNAGVQYQGQIQNGQMQHSVKATLSWSF